MIEQELKDIWRNSSETKKIQFDMTQLLTNFKTGMESRERIVRVRDRREIFGAIIGILGFGYIAYHTPFLVAKTGAILLIASYIFYIFKLRANRKSKHTQDLFLSIEEQLQHQKQFMVNQTKLLGSVLYWMVLPMFVSYMIYVWGVGDPSQYEIPSILLEALPINLRSKLIWSIVMIILSIYVVWMNKRAVVVNWKPLIKQIDTIIDQLKK
ncbi:hypothetical protein [Dokdonia sp.]|uniref:hypothetical protein n=1 Tax=Dokdonia sp. TaxID=2024995 RepID=UPI0032673FB1